MRKFLRPESRRLYRPASISIVTLRNPVPETRAGDGALNTFCSTCSIPGARPLGQIK